MIYPDSANPVPTAVEEQHPSRAKRQRSGIGGARHGDLERIMACLQDGRACTLRELARLTGRPALELVNELPELVQRGRLTVIGSGSHLYYRVRHTHAPTRRVAAADVLRALASACLRSGEPARSCYDHLAGPLAVALLDYMRAADWLEPSDGRVLTISPRGAAGFAALGVDVDAVRGARRMFAYECLDRSERRAHLGGALAAALLKSALAQGWIEKGGTARELLVCDSWRRTLRKVLPLSADA